jgi:hypothetical protein
MEKWDMQSIDLRVSLSKNDVLDMLLGMDSAEAGDVIVEAALRDAGIMQIITELVNDESLR